MNTTFSEPFIFSVGVKGILNEYTKEEIEKMYPKILDLKELEPGGGTSINPMHDESGSSGRILDAAATNVMASDKSLQSSGNLTNTSTHITSRGKRDKCSILNCFCCCFSRRNIKSTIVDPNSLENSQKFDEFAGFHKNEKLKFTCGSERVRGDVDPQVIYVEGIIH